MQSPCRLPKSRERENKQGLYIVFRQWISYRTARMAQWQSTVLWQSCYTGMSGLGTLYTGLHAQLKRLPEFEPQLEQVCRNV